MSANLESKAGKWIEDHMSKLNQYASALKRRDTGHFFDEGDFLNMMSMRLLLAERYVDGFMDQPDAYLFKTAWNEGLMMLRKQRRYEIAMTFEVEFDPENNADVESFIEEIPTPERNNPEIVQIEMEQHELISIAIQSLPEKSREVCVMLYAGKKQVEIAREMGFSSRSTINYHMNKIQEVFSRFGLQVA